MVTFNHLIFGEHPVGDGIRAVYNFENGYGISVIRSGFSYGGSQGLYEAAVLLDGDLCYDTPVTDDVLGWQTPEDITSVMKKIQELPDKYSRIFN